MHATRFQRRFCTWLHVVDDNGTSETSRAEEVMSRRDIVLPDLLVTAAGVLPQLQWWRAASHSCPWLAFPRPEQHPAMHEGRAGRTCGMIEHYALSCMQHSLGNRQQDLLTLRGVPPAGPGMLKDPPGGQNDVGQYSKLRCGTTLWTQTALCTLQCLTSSMSHTHVSAVCC